MRDSDPITRLTAARFDGPQALYTEAVRLLSERPALPDDLAGLVARLRKVSADARNEFAEQWADAQYTGERPDLEPITAELAVERVEDAADAIEALAARDPQCADLDAGPQVSGYTCNGCKHFKSEYWREPDGEGDWDSGTRADCLAVADKRNICVYHGSAPEVPDWCPHPHKPVTALRPEAEVRAEAWAAALEAAALKMAKGGLYTVWDRSEAIRTLTPPADISAAMDRIKAEEYARGLADGMLRGGADAAKAIADAKAGWIEDIDGAVLWERKVQ